MKSMFSFDTNKKAVTNKFAGNARNNFVKNNNNRQKSYRGQNDNFKAVNKFERKKGPVGGYYNYGKDHYANQFPLKRNTSSQTGSSRYTAALSTTSLSLCYEEER